QWTPAFPENLDAALEGGTVVYMQARHAGQFDRNFLQALLRKHPGRIYIDDTRGHAILPKRLDEVHDRWAPFRLRGSPVRYGVNRTSTGWLVMIANPAGVTKHPATVATPPKPAQVDPTKVATVSLEPRVGCKTFSELLSGRSLTASDLGALRVG